MLITIATFEYLGEAQLWKERLEAEGIPSFIFDEQMNSLYSIAIGGIKLKVLEEQAQEALKVLKTTKTL
ncbi:putative signal transducing protein [Candidatus Nucleicultrix amoebiphila]|jgi:hypothetical protein|uniref:putative signal transducing protein n=1 Tax=Candidatus Nucleicultrix amoebiphila TaxID=1509244 RepID=UPI0018DEC9EA|nr:DUF2007 domain-containing protein [Candidatus Nucleicultrix amoebiphila]